MCASKNSKMRVLRNRIFRDVGYERDEGNRLPGGVFLL